MVWGQSRQTGEIGTGEVIERVKVKRGEAQNMGERERESKREEKIVTVRGGRRRHTGGGDVECVNTQEHCIKPMHCSEAG